MGTSQAISGGIVPRDVIFIGTLKLPGDQELALKQYPLHELSLELIIHFGSASKTDDRSLCA